VNLAEGVQLVSFGILSAAVLLSALGVVLLKNVVYSAFLLGGSFISIAGLYFLLNADFVAAAQVLVYVGAINVLILFAIMLVNKDEEYAEVKGSGVRQVATALVCLGLFALLGTMVISTPWAISSETAAGDGSIVTIGIHFFTDFLLPFELVSVLLLMALIGAIVLARREFIPDIRGVDGQDDALMLPERQREMVASSSSEMK
jgi:NAD(P)H-quinone oxidoreductase subunit 6